MHDHHIGPHPSATTRHQDASQGEGDGLEHPDETSITDQRSLETHETQRTQGTQGEVEEDIQDQIDNTLNINTNVELTIPVAPEDNNDNDNTNTQQQIEANSEVASPSMEKEDNNDKINSNAKEGKKDPSEIIDTIKCDRFQKSNGLVPRIIYGLRGQRQIKLLSKNAQMYGKKLVLTWLNSPRAFKRPRAIQDTPNDKDTQERRNRISTRKFQHGDIGASWRALKEGITEKITPSDNQIANLFPKSIEGDITYRKTGETTISISKEELESVLKKLPRDRASGTSQLSCDHIRYAAMRDEGVFNMLLETLNYMLNNPNK